METHKPDPKRPYKAYAAALASLLTALLYQYNDSIPDTGKVIISIVITVIGVYVTPNPKIRA